MARKIIGWVSFLFYKVLRSWQRILTLDTAVRVGYPVGCGEVAWTYPTVSAVGPYISMGPGELGVGKARFCIDGDVGGAKPAPG
ncbi:unnamed protein product [Orchesella dallaii]|uniref:Uncharacterized protein n=1 Tax=Orchesella dallaii TaxID=48710 RepID=A0ABP1QZG8_9HEXA